MNVPKLRFSEFNDEWMHIRLGDISSLITKGTTPSKFSNEGVRFVKIESLENNFINNDKCLYIDKKTNDGPLKRSILYDGDLLFAIAGATIGKCGIMQKNNLPANTNQALAIIRLKKDINKLFVLNNLSSHKMKNYIFLNISVGAQPNLNLEQMGNYKFYLPSIKEQNKISNMLSLLDKKIELQSKKIEDLKLYKKGLLKIKYNTISKINPTSLINIAKIYQPQTIATKDIVQGTYPVFGANGIIGYHNNYNHKHSQVTISCRGENSGIINITPEKCWINGNSMVINIDNNKNILKDYLKYILECQNLSYLISGSGQPQIVRNDIINHKVPLPDINLQTNFVKIFIKLDNNINLNIKKIEKLKEFKKGLMQNMFV